MKISSSAKYVLGVAAAVAMLAGCSGGSGSQVAPGPAMGSNTVVHGHALHLKPQWSAFASLVPKELMGRPGLPLVGHPAPDIAMRGIYVTSFSYTTGYGFKKGNRSNPGSICTVPFSLSATNSIAVDGAGNFIDPDGGTRSIIIGAGPGMCGASAATISDTYGQPSDAASANALTGTIAVGNIFDNSGLPASVSLCSVSAGCTSNLTNSSLYELGGVAMDNGGNCYASGRNPSFTGAVLIYWAGCTGSGVVASGYVNKDYGSIDIDASGNLVTIDIGLLEGTTGAIYAYSGCNPTCTLLSTTTLTNNAVEGKLNSLHNNKLAVASFINSQIDIYKGSAASGYTYQYSFNGGVPGAAQGVAYNKRSPQ